MAKSKPFKYLLLILFLCLGLGGANLPAQEQSIILPPIPSVLPPDPPDPDTLPAPPQLEWEALPPRDSGGEPGQAEGLLVPPPEAETPLAPPPPPVEEVPIPGGPDPEDVELAKPEVEIWRPEGESPQVPERRYNRLAQTYVTGTEPVWLRVQFDPQAAGKSVLVVPGRGVTLQPPEAVMTIPGNGECLVLATLAEGLARSHVIFYCEGVKTVLPVVRAPLETVIAAEEGTGGSLQAAGGAPPLDDPNEDPEGTAGALRSQIETGGSYSAYSGGGTRIIRDLQVPSALGELDFTRYWNSVHNDTDYPHAARPFDFGASGWTHSWYWNAELVMYSEPFGGDGGYEMFHTQIIITFPDGHSTTYKVVRANRGMGLPPPYEIHAADPRLGQPYTPAEITTSWPFGGMGVHDHLTKMAVDGSEFYLSLADGGSVHFEWVESVAGSGYYRATEVFDPHGLKTELRYNSYGELYQVEQEGGRQLNIQWGTFGTVYPHTWRVITQVETGGAAGWQRVTYKYTRLHGGYFLVLQKATYENDPVPGQMTYARYTYGTCFGDEPEPCELAAWDYPLLKRADDPRYEGAMTKIRYDYRGTACDPNTVNPLNDHNWVPAQAEAIAVEKSDTNVLVSQFLIDCVAGERWETNGFGATRKFYFGSSAGTYEPASIEEGGPFRCRGFQLGKVTDFTWAPIGPANPCPPGVPCHRQNYSFGAPRHIWDARYIMTREFATDDSGSPSEVHHVGADGSSILYNRLDENGSETLHPTRMHNNNKRWLFWKKDERDQYTFYRRDARRRIKQIDYPGGSQETFEYDNNNPDGLNQVTKHRLPSGAFQHYEYDASHNLIREYNSVDILISPQDYKEYTYDSLGRVLTMTDGRARSSTPSAPFTVRMTYNGRHQVLSVEYASTTGTYPTVHYEYDDYGNCTAITNELGHRSTYAYDDYRRCTSYTEPLNAPGWNGSGTVASRRWDWIYDRKIEGDLETRSSYAHTSGEWRIQIEPVFNGDGHRRATARTFDVNNRILSERTGLIQLPTEDLGYNLQSVPETGTSRFTYDPNGQKSSFIDAQERVTTYGYDNRNRLETTTEPKRTNQPEHPVTRIAYDVAGNKKVVTFPDTRTQKWDDYDAFGQAWKFTSERNHETHLAYQWGPMKKLAQVITYRDGESQPTTFTYDGMGRPEETEFPDTTTEFSAYQFGQLSAFKTRRGQTKRLYYDVRGREDYHTWDLDAAPGIDRTWDAANRLTRIANLWSTIEYGYDAAGQAKWEQSNVLGSNGPVQLTYFRYPTGEVSKMIYPNGTNVDRFHTARGQLKDVGWGAGATSYVYHPDARVKDQFRTNGVTTTYEYDGRGMIWSLRHTKGGHDLAKRDYWRDDRDRILAWKRGFDTAHNPMENGRGNRYRYDEEGQLTHALYRANNPETETPSGEVRMDSFVYDQLGNRKGWNHVASRGAMEFVRRENNGLNQYHSWANNIAPPNPSHWGSGVFYDDNVAPFPSPPWIPPGNGVLMQDGYITADFNALNQPKAIWSKAYPGGDSAQWMYFGYDPLGRCVKRWVGTGATWTAGYNPATYYYYDGWNLVQEGTNAVPSQRTYVHGGRVDEIVASWGNGQWYNHHYDAQGNCILLSTAATGGIAEQYDYDAFGLPYVYQANGTLVPLKLGSPAGNRFLFTGREWIKDLRLYDYRHRMYQPELGRFLQPDPKHFAAGDYNLYRYCHNDPVNKIDPMGLAADVFVDLGFIGYDIYKLVTEGGGQGGENWKALVLDGGAAVVPFATGAGMVYRAGKAADRASDAVRASKYEDTTKAASIPNRATDVTRNQFEKNLAEGGWQKSTSKDGKVTNYEKDGAKYSVRGDSKSTGGPTADYYKAGSEKPDLKIRLKKDE